jgi:hypothetical protein
MIHSSKSSKDNDGQETFESMQLRDAVLAKQDGRCYLCPERVKLHVYAMTGRYADERTPVEPAVMLCKPCKRRWDDMTYRIYVEFEQKRFRALPKKQGYIEYIRSPIFKRIRNRVLERDKHLCRLCQKQGRERQATDVHHLHYDRFFGDELDSDLISVCSPCHPAADRQREANKAEEIRQKGEDTRYHNGLDTFATSRYGENWHYDYERAQREFDEFLERQDRY